MDPDYAQQSMLSWVLSALGSTYTILLPLSALISFIAVLVLVFRGKTPMAVAAILLCVLAPSMIGLFAFLQGTIYAYYEIANGGATPEMPKVVEANATSLVPPFAALFMSIPTYAVATIGTFFRSFPRSPVHEN